MNNPMKRLSTVPDKVASSLSSLSPTTTSTSVVQSSPTNGNGGSSSSGGGGIGAKKRSFSFSPSNIVTENKTQNTPASPQNNNTPQSDLDEFQKYTNQNNMISKHVNNNSFTTDIISNNLNPRWRRGSRCDSKNNNVGIFKIHLKPHVFFGMILEVEVLCSQNRLIGTALIDLMEWDETSCNRSNLKRWYPLYAPNEAVSFGAVLLHMNCDISGKSEGSVRATIR